MRPVPASVAVAAVLAAAYLVWSPPSQDLAAATFRADLFAEHGFVFWNDTWYSGHYLFAYSLLYPPLGALLGVRLVAALAVVASAALFAALAERRFGGRALAPSLWFAVGVASWLLTGRVPFLLGVPLGIGALLAIDRGRMKTGGLLAAGASLASPVAGLFIALAGVAVALAGRPREGAWLAVPAGGLIGALSFAFPTAGEEPFVFSAFIAIPLLAAAVLLLVPAEHRALRIGAGLYAILALGIVVIADPLGGNVTRLGALFAGPVLALVLPRGPLVVAAISVPLLYWQLVGPVRDVGRGVGDPATEKSFYEPLIAELDRVPRARVDTEPPFALTVHVPPTQNRWEAAHVAPEYPIARGWLRQLEADDFELFTGARLTADAYRTWLYDHGVEYVAVADAELDYLAEDEVALIDSGLPYLDRVWSSPDWRLFRVNGSPGIVSPLGATADVAPAAISIDGSSAFRLEGAAGRYLVRLHWTPYWEVSGVDACVEPDGGWTRVELEERGSAFVEAVPSLDGLLRRDRSCSE